MLKLSRRTGEEIWIDRGQIVIRVESIHGDRCSIGIAAPRHIEVHRAEVARALGHRVTLDDRRAPAQCWYGLKIFSPDYDRFRAIVWKGFTARDAIAGALLFLAQRGLIEHAADFVLHERLGQCGSEAAMQRTAQWAACAIGSCVYLNPTTITTRDRVA